MSTCKQHFGHLGIYALILILTCYIKRHKCSGHFGFLCLKCLHLILTHLWHVSYSYFHDCKVSGNYRIYKLHLCPVMINCWGSVTRPRVTFNIVLHYIIHLYKHAIQLWFYLYSLWWGIGGLFKCIQILHGCTSIWFVGLCSLMEYLSLLRKNMQHYMRC